MGDAEDVGDLHVATVVMNVTDMHLDLYTDDQDRHVRRLVDLGATRPEDWPYPEGADFVVLRDPDGDEFCVIDHADLA